ncbi:MAG: (Fe-S)-binding protein [Candidatus Rokuibacteriota bacterium]
MPSADLLVTCLVDLFYPDVGVAMVRLLRRHGVEVRVPEGQTCCGLPLFNSGYQGAAARVARRTIPLFASAEHIVVPSGSCAWMVKAEYPHLFPDDAAMTATATALASRTYELSQFLVTVLGVGGESRPPGSPLRATYHDSCHLLRGLGESRAPRTLLRAAGVDVVELTGADECCGFGGSFSVRLPEVSGAILRRKLDNIRASGADVVVACDAGCIMQMAGGVARARDRVRVLHLAELLEECVGDGQERG